MSLRTERLPLKQKLLARCTSHQLVYYRDSMLIVDGKMALVALQLSVLFVLFGNIILEAATCLPVTLGPSPFIIKCIESHYANWLGRIQIVPLTFWNSNLFFFTKGLSLLHLGRVGIWISAKNFFATPSYCKSFCFSYNYWKRRCHTKCFLNLSSHAVCVFIK